MNTGSDTRYLEIREIFKKLAAETNSVFAENTVTSTVSLKHKCTSVYYIYGSRKAFIQTGIDVTPVSAVPEILESVIAEHLANGGDK